MQMNILYSFFRRASLANAKEIPAAAAHLITRNVFYFSLSSTLLERITTGIILYIVYYRVCLVFA